VVAYVQAIRKEELFKSPGVAETLDWASALVELDAVALDPSLVSDTLGVLLKYQDDIAKIQGTKAKELLDQRESRAAMSRGDTGLAPLPVARTAAAGYPACVAGQDGRIMSAAEGPIGTGHLAENIAYFAARCGWRGCRSGPAR
jgi:hypothetical protein